MIAIANDLSIEAPDAPVISSWREKTGLGIALWGNRTKALFSEQWIAERIPVGRGPQNHICCAGYGRSF
jgi:hypothetical protein